MPTCRPPDPLTFAQFINRTKDEYYRRNMRDFAFAGEAPSRAEPSDGDDGSDQDETEDEDDAAGH